MKTKDYIDKHELHRNDQFDHKEFTADLTNEFFSLLEVGKNKEGQLNIKGYENAVNCIRRKWDAVNNKTVGQLPEKLWSYFYATVIAKMREELFPEQMQQREAKRREYEERKQARQRAHQSPFGSFDEDMWSRLHNQFLFAAILTSNLDAKMKAFEKLGLPVTASEDEVNKQYRTLSLKHHPDRGGKQEDFIAITEAKNKCMAFFSKTN